MSVRFPLNFRNVMIAILLPVVIVLISSCNSTNKLKDIKRLDPTETAESTATLPIVDTAMATIQPTFEPTPTETMVPTPTTAVEVDELGIRKEFTRDEVMTKEEIKANVDWFYNLTDEELNKIVEGNLFSSDEYPKDSRSRDIEGNLLSNKEDLGWFYSKNKYASGGINWDANYFNTIYLGTTYVQSEGLNYNISAFGSKDFLGNKIVIYASNSIKDFGVDYFDLSESKKDRVFSTSSIKPLPERTAIQNLLLNYQRKVVMIDVVYFHKLGNLSGVEESLMLSQLIGGKLLIDNLNKQRDGSLIDNDEILSTHKGDILVDSYAAKDLTSFVFVNSTAVFRDN